MRVSEAEVAAAMEANRPARAANILRSALRRAEEVVDTSGDRTWGPWYVRADQRVIYKVAIEHALAVLEGKM